MEQEQSRSRHRHGTINDIPKPSLNGQHSLTPRTGGFGGNLKTNTEWNDQHIKIQEPIYCYNKIRMKRKMSQTWIKRFLGRWLKKGVVIKLSNNTLGRIIICLTNIHLPLLQLFIGNCGLIIHNFNFGSKVSEISQTSAP